jgi:hypothetical protein
VIAKRPDRLGHDMERPQLWDFASIVQGDIHGERSSGVAGVQEWWSDAHGLDAHATLFSGKLGDLSELSRELFPWTRSDAATALL